MVLQKEITKKIKDLLKKNPQGLSITEIVGTINVNRNTAGRYLENLLVSGQVELRRFGMAKIYMLSQRVPLSAVLSISSELVIQLDHNLRIIFINEPFLDLIGTEEKEVLGKNIEFTAVTGVFDDAFAGFIQRIREGIAGQEWSGEMVLNTKNSILFCRIAPTVFEDGRKGVSVILEDITERRKGERALQESEATARALINAPTDSVILTDTRGVMLDLNDTAAFRLKKPKADLIGTLADTSLPENVAQSRRRVISRILETKQMVRFEDERDGTWFDTVAYPIIVGDGEVSRVAIIARDITDRKTAESKVRESEAKLRSIAENSPDMILLLNPDLEIVYANRLPALNPDKILDKSIFYLIPEKFREIAAASFRYVLETGKPSKFNIEYDEGYNFAQNGKVYFESVVGPVIQDEKITALVIVARDITERKKANDALRESEDRYRTLVEISPDAVFLHREGTIIYANPAAIRLLGGSYAGEIIGKEILDFISPEFRDIIRTNIQKDLNGEVSPRTELRMIRLDGRPIIVDGQGTTTLIDGIPTVQVAIRDITEQKLAEEALKIRERQLSSVYGNVPDVLFYLSVEPDNRFRFLTVNQSFLDKLQLREDQVAGKYVDEVIPEPLCSRAHQKYDQAIREKTKIHWEEVQEYPTGKRYGDSYVTAIFDENGHPTNIIGSVHDSTGHRQVEESLRKSETMYRTLAESSADLIFVIGRDDRVEYVNSYASALVNRPVDRIIGAPRTSLFLPDVAHAQKKALEKVFDTGEPVRSEGVLTFTGRMCWFDHYLIPLKEADNRVRSVLGISRDITDRKKTDLALRDNENRLRLLLDSTEDLIFMQNPEGQYLYFNATAKYGISGEKMVGSTPYDFLDPESAERLVERVKTVVKTGQTIHEESRFGWKGQTLWFSDTLSPVQDPQGTVTAVVTISQNITGRKQAEIALRESEATARALLNAPTDSVILIDDKGIILEMNETAASRFGKRSDELVGTLSYNLLPEEVARSRKLLMAPLFAKKEMVRFTDERDGKWYDTVAYPIVSETGYVQKIAIIARDITGQKNIEHQLHVSEQAYKQLLKKSFESVDQFLR